MAYNNDVTYDKKLDTDENKVWSKKLNDKYFDRSYCSPSCPNGWAKEVYELLELFNSRLGIERNTKTLRAYYPQGNFVDWFFKSPFKNAWFTFVSQFFKPKPEWQRKTYNTTEKLQKVVSAFIQPFNYGFKCIKVKYINPVINYILKPKFRLSQVKEKYGELVIYFDADEMYTEWIEKQIMMTKIKLSVKGVYYPIESLYNASSSKNVDNEYNPDTVEVEKGISSYDNKPYIKVTQTVYRNLMKEMGLDLQAIAIKAMVAADKKKDK